MRRVKSGAVRLVVADGDQSDELVLDPVPNRDVLVRLVVTPTSGVLHFRFVLLRARDFRKVAAGPVNPELVVWRAGRFRQSQFA